MSSDPLDRGDSDHFVWGSEYSTEDYVIATYYVETRLEPERVALSIAREQSAVTTTIPMRSTDIDLSGFSAKVMAVSESSGEIMTSPIDGYSLGTGKSGLGGAADRVRAAEVTIAYPATNFGESITGLWNAIAGEVHRLGSILGLRVGPIRIPASLARSFTGPRFGARGLRSLLGGVRRPLFCRSCRPAVGLPTEVMVAINREVLLGGFDVVKDDELTCDTAVSPFRERVQQMTAMVRDVEQQTGEGKLYFCSVIDSPRRAFEWAEVGVEHGVDGFVVAPALQGLEICRDLSERFGKPILCHNSWQDVYTRNPQFGVEAATMFQLQNLSGADLIMMPGSFGTLGKESANDGQCVDACRGFAPSIAASMPILAGGKTPDGLHEYVSRVGSADFMVIAATAVDEHPGGPREGARAFRESWHDLSTC